MNLNANNYMKFFESYTPCSNQLNINLNDLKKIDLQKKIHTKTYKIHNTPQL